MSLVLRQLGSYGRSPFGEYADNLGERKCLLRKWEAPAKSSSRIIAVPRSKAASHMSVELRAPPGGRTVHSRHAHTS